MLHTKSAPCAPNAEFKGGAPTEPGVRNSRTLELTPPEGLSRSNIYNHPGQPGRQREERRAAQRQQPRDEWKRDNARFCFSGLLCLTRSVLHESLLV